MLAVTGSSTLADSLSASANSAAMLSLAIVGPEDLHASKGYAAKGRDEAVILQVSREIMGTSCSQDRYSSGTTCGDTGPGNVPACRCSPTPRDRATKYLATSSSVLSWQLKVENIFSAATKA